MSISKKEILNPGYAAFVVHTSLVAFLEEMKAQEAVAASKELHPVVEVYNGSKPLVVIDAQGRPASMTIVPLHVSLLCPTASFDSEDERLADADQIRTTARNWAMILSTLLPTFFRSSDDARDGRESAALTYSAWLVLRGDPGLMDRMHYSYGIALHFFGWRLHDQATGTLDRHKNWRSRYDSLGNGRDPVYASVTWILRHLLEFMLVSYAHRLGLFLLEEFAAGRLLPLREAWRQWWWPMIRGCSDVDAAAKQQLQRCEENIDASDSD